MTEKNFVGSPAAGGLSLGTVQNQCGRMMMRLSAFYEQCPGLVAAHWLIPQTMCRIITITTDVIGNLIPSLSDQPRAVRVYKYVKPHKLRINRTNVKLFLCLNAVCVSPVKHHNEAQCRLIPTLSLRGFRHPNILHLVLQAFHKGDVSEYFSETQDDVASFVCILIFDHWTTGSTSPPNIQSVSPAWSIC